MSHGNSYALIRSVSGRFDDVLASVRQGLAQQGFGILTEIDMAATLHNKLQVSWPRTIVLGACNPPLAHRAMMAVKDVTVFLPCNVVVREDGKGGVEVAAMNPEVIGDIVANSQLGEVVAEVTKKIKTVLDGLV